MTTILTRPPLQTLSMSTVQSNSRRHSARLQHKDDTSSVGSSAYENRNNGSSSKAAATSQSGTKANTKRRRDYDEEDDGFTFSRVKKTKTSAAVESATGVETNLPSEKSATPPRQGKPIPLAQEHLPISKSQRTQDENQSDVKARKRRNRMSFSTPAAKQQQPTRKSKRLSDDAELDIGSPQPKARQKDIKVQKVRRDESRIADKPQSPQARSKESQDNGANTTTPAPISSDEQHSATKISLPFADTPIISRNKAMRKDKHKGERRSSLGLRGRRASSLLDSGTSNALPHSEVSIADFYKHIESDLLEPRRMRLLLSWCGTKAMHPKPQGTSFEDASAKSAARVIEEEVLKEIANKSELSYWFSREDDVAPAVPLPQRPNPKNVQNAQKIIELEEQIKRLKAEKNGLEALLRPPTIEPILPSTDDVTDLNSSLLSESDAELLKSLQNPVENLADIQSRMDAILGNIGPSIDTFADGIHRIAQYRTAADNLSGRVLSLCAERLAEREKKGRREALQAEDYQSPGHDLGSVLRGLGRADR